MECGDTMIREFHAYYDDDTHELKGVMDSDNRVYDIDKIVDKLNDLEQTRIRNRRIIAECREREDRFQRIISGLMAYLELRINEELWWDWNDTD